MSDKPWEVWDGSDHHGSFRTLAAAEKFARRRVTEDGQPLEIWLDHRIAYVRADGLGRVWTDVVDCTVA